MKTPPTSHSTLRKGYVSILGVMSISIVLLLILVSAYRFAVQTQDIQKRNQVYIDYAAREQAMLRAVLSLAPNAAMKAMMSDSDSNPLKEEASWKWVFDEAIALADTEMSVSSTEMTALGIPSSAISGNSANASSWGDARTLVSPLTGIRSSGFGITRGLSDQEAIIGTTGFPEFLDAVNTDMIRIDDNYPLISSDKYYDNPATQYKLIDYPKVHFGYAAQGQQFVAKRNWWAFTINMGNEDTDSTGYKPEPKDYILSIYEIPSQLALGSTAMTNLGQHADGTDWANVSVTGGAFASEAETKGSFALTRLSSRKGITLSDSSSVGGLGSGGTLPTREVFEAANNDFFPLTTSSDSGLVAFIPINVGDAAYDNIADLQDENYGTDNRLSPTAWSDYSRPAVQCVMKLKVIEVQAFDDQTPTGLTFSYLSGGIEATETYLRSDGTWPTASTTEGASFPFHFEQIPDGRMALVVYVERLVTHLNSLGADSPDINSSLAVSADYLTNPDITQPNIPSAPNDLALVLRETDDFTDFTSGFSMVSPFRLYLADDVNLEPFTAGGTDYPPLSLFAPEKRFGLRTNPMQIEFDGQLNHLTKEASTINPLDLKSGRDETVVPTNITANLYEIADPADLPPINQMNWLVVIEEVH